MCSTGWWLPGHSNHHSWSKIRCILQQGQMYCWMFNDEWWETTWWNSILLVKSPFVLVHSENASTLGTEHSKCNLNTWCAVGCKCLEILTYYFRTIKNISHVRASSLLSGIYDMSLLCSCMHAQVCAWAIAWDIFMFRVVLLEYFFLQQYRLKHKLKCIYWWKISMK